MNGDFTFDGREWPGVEILSRELPPPEVKTAAIDVPGLNGVIDLSADFFGPVRYKNRPITLTLGVKDKETFDFHAFYTAVHGRSGKLIFADDPDHYYTGRAAVTGTDITEDMTKIGISIDAEPFRYNAEKTQLELPIASQNQKFQFTDYLNSIEAQANLIPGNASCDASADCLVLTGNAGTAANFNFVLPAGVYLMEYYTNAGESATYGVDTFRTGDAYQSISRPVFSAEQSLQMTVRVTLKSTGTVRLYAKKYRATPAPYDTGANWQVPDVNAPIRCKIARYNPMLDNWLLFEAQSGFESNGDLELTSGVGLLAAFDYYNAIVDDNITIIYQRGDI